MNPTKRRSVWLLYTFALLILLAESGRAGTESQPPASAEVTAAMQPYLDSYKFAGYVAVIADKSGKVRYKAVIGYADVEEKTPMREDNLFWIASMTKMFAGASIMMLVDEGKIKLDDSVTRHRSPGC